MAERKATNKYIPPDFDPKKHGSVNGYRNSHHLRKRASKLSEGILVVRFEMPFNVWCESCGAHIGMGVRYNAEKKKVGKYLSTPIWSFGMRCRLCSGRIEIQTDPKNAEYLVISGARRKVETYDPEEAGLLSLPSAEESAELANDPLKKLEHDVLDAKKADDAKPFLSQLQDYQERTWSDPYTVNRTLRAKQRMERKLEAEDKAERAAVQNRLQLSVPVLPASEKDTELARDIMEEERRRKLAENGSGFSVVIDDSDALQNSAPAVKAEWEQRKRKRVDGSLISGLLDGQSSSPKDLLAARVRMAKIGDPFGINPVPLGTKEAEPAGRNVRSAVDRLVAYSSDSDGDD